MFKYDKYTLTNKRNISHCYMIILLPSFFDLYTFNQGADQNCTKILLCAMTNLHRGKNCMKIILHQGLILHELQFVYEGLFRTREKN